jgi:hypothetical protein
MDVAGVWAERIARRFTPAEASFAAEVGMAYAAGGSERAELLPGHSVQPGAFGPGGWAELPMILQALASIGPALKAFLGSPQMANALAAASLLTALRQGRPAESPQEPGQPAQVQPPAGPVDAEPVPAGNERQAVRQAFLALRERLKAAGFDQVRVGELAYGLLEELLSDTAGAAMFLDSLTAVADDGAARPRKANRRISGRRKDPR